MMFDDLSLLHLRKRASEKWTKYPDDVLPAFIAEMDFPLAPAVSAALATAIENGDCGYAQPGALKPSFRQFVRSRFDWSVEERDIFVVPDVMAGIAESIVMLTRPGDGVVINPPVYPPFFEVIRTIGRKVVEVPLVQPSPGLPWALDLDALETAFAGGARSYLLCSPHNPVGRVWSKSELAAVAALATRFNVAVVADEVHAALTMPGKDFVSYLRIAGESPSVTVVTSASKAFNIAGLKCAIVVAGSRGLSDAMREAFSAKPSDIAWRVGHLGVVASIAAFECGAIWLDELRRYLDGNRRLVGELLATRMPKVRYVAPEAGYLAWIDCCELGYGDDPAAHMLERGRVALEPGSKFGKQGASYVRMNFGTSAAMVDQIIARMAHAGMGPH